MLNRFFELFAFEKTSASPKAPEELYSEEVIDSDIYIGLIGSDYGNVLESGISPTEREYDLFNKVHNDAFIFIKNTQFRDDETTKFIDKVKGEHSYQRFDNRYELFQHVRESLADFLNRNLKNYKAFDRELLLDSSCDDVDEESLELFFNFLEYKPLETLREDKGLVNVLSVINAGGWKDGEFRLNTSGALFFARDPSKFNISHEVKMVRFFDYEGVKTFQKTFVNTSILKVLREAEIFFYKTTNHYSQINGFKRETVYEYPFEAIREALVNALAHRDYTIQSASITFYIYPDRIEIKSPGRLVYPLKACELGDNKPIHRNETICRIFSKTTYMEHVGTGIKRMRDVMKKNGLDEPEFVESGEFFKVIFRSKNNNILNDRQRIFFKLNVKEITTQEYMDMFDISRNTAVKDLNQLIELNFIDKKKNGRIVYYKLKD